MQLSHSGHGVVSDQSGTASAASAVPLLLIATWCFTTMDPSTIVIVSSPATESGFIEWDGGKLRLLDSFYGIEVLGQGLRGAISFFAPSTLGFDSIGSWQFFQFLTDIGPLYSIWYLESSRPLNARSPAYLPTLFTFLGGIVGVGTVVPLYYFLCIAFGPSVSELDRSPRQQSRSQYNTAAVPMIFLFHKSVVFAMFMSPDLAARHNWTWAWQMSPLFVGIGNAVASTAFGLGESTGSGSGSHKAPPGLMLSMMTLVSAGVWVYTFIFYPHSLSTLFVPQAGPQTGLILHMRKALQADEIGASAGAFMWLAHPFFDLYNSGLAGVRGSCAALALGWYLREGILENATTA
ncbi:hypothetical protein PG988_013831 [Apiospora saccharicola]